MRKQSMWVGIAVLFSTLASAEVQVFPGANCVGYKDTVHDIWYSGAGAFNNRSSTQSLVCPLPVRIHEHSNGELMVLLADRNSSVDFTCVLLRCSELYGTSCSTLEPSSTERHDLIGGGEYIIMGFDDIGQLATQSHNDNFAIQCDVPKKTNVGRSGIASYRLFGND